MRTTNCKISMFCSVSSICHSISDVCKFNFYLPFTKKLLLCIFATKVGYVLMTIYVCSLNVFCQGSDTSWGNQSLGSAPQKH